MKLIFAIVQNDDSKRLIRELVKHHISVTRISLSLIHISEPTRPY